MTPLRISQRSVRRYMLGRQGLWPGRRWRGREGTVQALCEIEAVQVDPLNVIARSHDLVLWGRVIDYCPSDLDSLLYEERQFFDYGGTVFILPMHELPYWRVVMQRRTTDKRWSTFAAENGKLLDEVRAELRDRGPLGNRDLKGTARVTSYRARKDTGLALYYLWLTGELMTHHRRGFDRVYFFRDEIAPERYNYCATEAESDAFFARKAAAFLGLAGPRGWAAWYSGLMERQISRDEGQQALQQMLDTGVLAAVSVEASDAVYYTTADDAALLEEIEAGVVPKAWQPLDTTTEQEVTFLAPLDIVSARGRAKVFFDFEYLWEIYKPAEKRRWGYYTMPILYGDQLVARIDPKLDREAMKVVVNGLWLEDPAFVDNPSFVAALARGLVHMRRFVGAQGIDLAAVVPAALRSSLQAQTIL